MFHVKHFGGRNIYAHGNREYVSLGDMKGNQGYRIQNSTVLGVDKKSSKFNITTYAAVILANKLYFGNYHRNTHYRKSNLGTHYMMKKIKVLLKLWYKANGYAGDINEKTSIQIFR